MCDVMRIENEPSQMLEAQDHGGTDPVGEHLREDVRVQVPEAQPRELALPELPDVMVIRRHNLMHAGLRARCFIPSGSYRKAADGGCRRNASGAVGLHIC